MRPATRRLPAIVVASVGLLVAGCAADIPEADPADDGGDRMVWVADDDIDLAEVELAIGSKDSVEQEILGWIAVEAARAAGAEVHQEIGAGGTSVVRQAELSGLIDAYWEYTGTGWERILQQTDPAATPTELYEAVRDRDEEQNQIDWLPPAPLNSAYAIAATPDVMEARGVRTLADLAATFALDDTADTEAATDEPADGRTTTTTTTEPAEGESSDNDSEPAILCVGSDSDFVDSPGGLRQFQRAFDVRVPASQRPEVADEDLFDLAEIGMLCPFIQVLNTDPRLADGTLEVLEDRGTFTIYNPAMTIRADVSDDVPGFADLIAGVAPRLTDQVMRELRHAVEIDGDSARDVARAWLEDEGLAETAPGGN